MEPRCLSTRVAHRRFSTGAYTATKSKSLPGDPPGHFFDFVTFAEYTTQTTSCYLPNRGIQTTQSTKHRGRRFISIKEIKGRRGWERCERVRVRLGVYELRSLRSRFGRAHFRASYCNSQLILWNSQKVRSTNLESFLYIEKVLR